MTDQERLRPAGFWIRAAATAIDALVLAAPLSLINDPLGGTALYLGYHALLEATPLQATIGKASLKLWVVDPQGRRVEWWRAIARQFAEMLSSILMLGYLLAAVSRDKRALHDRIVGTWVTHRPRRAVASAGEPPVETPLAGPVPAVPVAWMPPAPAPLPSKALARWGCAVVLVVLLALGAGLYFGGRWMASTAKSALLTGTSTEAKTVQTWWRELNAPEVPPGYSVAAGTRMDIWGRAIQAFAVLPKGTDVSKLNAASFDPSKIDIRSGTWMGVLITADAESFMNTTVETALKGRGGNQAGRTIERISWRVNGEERPALTIEASEGERRLRGTVVAVSSGVLAGAVAPSERFDRSSFDALVAALARGQLKPVDQR